MNIKTILKCVTCVALTVSMYFVAPTNAKAITADEITAPSAILMDEKTGTVLFEKDAHQKRACASITKVMTLTLVFEALDSDKIKMTDMVTASKHASSMGGSDIWLEEGEQLSVDDMIKATTVASANDTAVALAEYVSGSEEEFVRQMNKKAKELNMKETTFKNCNGLDEEGHITSAYDVAIMSKELMKHKEILNYSGIWIDYLRDGATQIVNTNKLLKTYKGITGLKTGTTNDAGSCISATATRDKLSLIAVVLGSKTGKERFADASKLLDYGFANYVTVTPKLEKQLKEVEVANGMIKTVATTAKIEGSMLVEKADKDKIECKIEYKKDLVAPIKEGDTVGNIKYYIGEKEVCSYNITAQSNIEEISFESVLELLYKCLIMT